jgi:hypothetical protein
MRERRYYVYIMARGSTDAPALRLGSGKQDTFSLTKLGPCKNQAFWAFRFSTALSIGLSRTTFTEEYKKRTLASCAQSLLNGNPTDRH